MPAFPSPVQTYHTDTYPAINPSNPELSTKGKNIVITGAGSGIGSAVAESFAISGASNVSILGRTAGTLGETKDKLQEQYPGTRFHSYMADIVDKQSLVKAFKAIKESTGLVDILIANAGFLPNILPIAKSDPEEWLNAFEINVKGNFHLFNAFIPVAAPSSTIINVSTGITHSSTMPGFSGYHTSKLAAAKFFDYVHQEHPDLFVLSVHPGVIQTAMALKADVAGVELPYDTSKSTNYRTNSPN